MKTRDLKFSSMPIFMLYSLMAGVYNVGQALPGSDNGIFKPKHTKLKGWMKESRRPRR